MLFFDTSALAKRYSTEPCTDVVADLIEDSDQSVQLSTISAVEIGSTLRR